MSFSETEFAIVKSLSTLRDVPPDVLRHYLDAAPEALIKALPDEAFVEAGTQDPGLYIVLHGIVELFSTDRHGKDKTQDFHQAGAMLGTETLFNKQGLPYSARGLTDASLLHLPPAIVAEWMDMFPGFARSLLSLVVRRIDFLDKDMLTFRTKKATARIVCYLLCHFNRAPRTPDGSYSLDVPIPRRKLASRLGITGPHLSRAFRELQDAGLLIPKGRGYFIPNVPALSRYVCPAGCDFGDG